jgi:enoyl-CoA hydratase
MYENIIVENKERVALITINRPNQLNALNSHTIKELNGVLETLNLDKKTDVVILTGAGDKSFVAGADIKEFAHFSVAEGGELAKKGQETLFSFIENMRKPVIAAVNGFALGGGLELAMACHLRVASINAKMGLPEVSLGVIPGYGGTQRLPQLVGRGKANEMIFTAGMISADEAKEWGLVNNVFEQEVLLEECYKIASKIQKNSPRAIEAAINAVNAGFDNRQNGYDREILEFGRCFGTEEFIEGTTAFMEKRKANFRG